jgi:hypothetical protein
MGVSEAYEQAPAPFLFSSEAGYALCRRYPQEDLTIRAQTEGICKPFDKVDLLAVLPTGSGKTSFLSMYMLVVLAIQKGPSLCPTAKFPRNPGHLSHKISGASQIALAYVLLDIVQAYDSPFSWIASVCLGDDCLLISQTPECFVNSLQSYMTACRQFDTRMQKINGR